MYVTKHGQLDFSEPGNEPGQCKIKSDKQQDEEANKETQFFLTHDIQSYALPGTQTWILELFATLLRLWYICLLFSYAA